MPNHFETFESYIPVDLLSPGTFLMALGVVGFFIVFRFFILVSGFHLVFYRWKVSWASRRQIYSELPGKKEMQYEIFWSLWTSLIFAFFGVLLGVLWQMGWTQIYLPFDAYGWWYLPTSWLLILGLHDTYFYWMHILMHKKPFYKKMHYVHHASLKPSPWASFSFHPLEAFIEALILPLLVLLIPVHPLVLIFHLTFMTLTAVLNHLGFEVLPKSWRWVGRWFICGLHHSQHHKHFQSNFGLFFTFWDRLGGTQNADFESQWEKL